MHIGTPLSSTATRVMLLGSGELGKEVIIALQRLGVEVIAVDRYENAPGHQVAHRAHVINMADGAALRTLIEKEKPHFIVPEIEAIATDMLVQIEEEGKVPCHTHCPCGATHHESRRHSPSCRRDVVVADIALQVRGQSSEELIAATKVTIGFPCIIKPVMSSSGKGQSKVDDASGIQAAWDYAASGSRVNQGRVIVEGFIDFVQSHNSLCVRWVRTAR